jgi:hypothetical protein
MRLLNASLVVLAMVLIAGCAQPPEVEQPSDAVNEKQQPSPVRIVTITARQFDFTPDNVTVGYNESILLTVTSVDVGHGFALPDFGINQKVPAGESIELKFTADKRGEFRFFNPVYSGSGWKDMTGVLNVR